MLELELLINFEWFNRKKAERWTCVWIIFKSKKMSKYDPQGSKAIIKIPLSYSLILTTKNVDEFWRPQHANLR